MVYSSLRLAMFSWAAAVLVVSPNLAASSCWACCSQQLRDFRQAGPQSNVKRSCCDRHRVPVRQELPACPKCESSRPVQATVPGPANDWRLKFALSEWLAPQPESSARTAGQHDCRADAVPQTPRPALTVLYCSWLE